ncbi:glycosyltransferase family protein [Calditrichota bacterium GD2]
MINLAFFVTSHGYGHAARACAIMQTFLQKFADIHFLIFSETPEWFFEDSLSRGSFTYFNFFTDVGLAQRSPFEEDIPQTLELLKKHFPFKPQKINDLARLLKRFQVKLILNDIPALGILAGKEAGIPTVLIENFTWDWIYGHYRGQFPELLPFIDYLASIYQSVDVHFKARPFVVNDKRAIETAPIARPARKSASATRQALQLNADKPVVLISTGGIVTRHRFVSEIKKIKDFYFIVPHDVAKMERDDNLVVLPHHSPFYHPDLVAASDVVVCKAGYSTVAEVYLHQKKIVLVNRPFFPESAIIESFVKKNLAGVAITPQTFNEGRWTHYLNEVLQKKEAPRDKVTSGAEVVVKNLEAFLN